MRIVNYGNTRRVEEPRLSQGAGGLIGPEIFPTTLDNVRRTRARFGDALEIIATGGVDSPDKAAALLDAGATGRLLLHRIHHARARCWRGASWNDCAHSRVRSELPTACPHVHRYPQSSKSARSGADSRAQA